MAYVTPNHKEYCSKASQMTMLLIEIQIGKLSTLISIEIPQVLVKTSSINSGISVHFSRVKKHKAVGTPIIVLRARKIE